ncbi:SMI1/KNR4 family protein [Ramlibacter sp.]|uniref:SMI1/KNR4 family protein n=1 Tax=Ramlibacter sp. TaxID=1917967 RepID=UPI003D0CB931
MEELAKSILSARRKGLFRTKRIFEPYSTPNSDDLRRIEAALPIPLPNELRTWLLLAGFGDIGEELSFREEWFAAIESGPLRGSTRFAQDILGNFYAFDLSGSIYYICRSEPKFAPLSNSFFEFIDELVRRDYHIVEWVSALDSQPYEW